MNEDLSWPNRGGATSPWSLFSLAHERVAAVGSSRVAVARDVDELLLAASPAARVVRLTGEIETLATVDRYVQDFLELISAALQPTLDADENETLPALFWLHASEGATSPVLLAVARRLLRSGPALLALAQWQLAGPLRPAVAQAAITEIAERRTHDSDLDHRMSQATRDLTTAFPEQKGPVALAGAIILFFGGVVYLADTINPTHLPE